MHLQPNCKELCVAWLLFANFLVLLQFLGHNDLLAVAHVIVAGVEARLHFVELRLFAFCPRLGALLSLLLLSL